MEGAGEGGLDEFVGHRQPDGSAAGTLGDSLTNAALSGRRGHG